MVTDRDIRVLFSIATYFVLSRPQINRLCYPADATGRVTRRRLQVLVESGLIRRHRAEFRYPNSAPAGSVYFPSEKGIQYLAEQTGDDAYLTISTQVPQPHHINHWLAVAETHIQLDAAIAGQDQVQIDGWLNEWDVCNPDEKDPAKRFALFTLIKESPRLVCKPDAAWLLTVQIPTGGELRSVSKVFLLEQDLGTTGASQFAARKHKGFAELLNRQLHKRYFPSTNVDAFTVICITPTQTRMNALRRAMKGKPGSELWKFASADQLSSKTFLFESVFHPVVGDPMPLVNLNQVGAAGGPS